MPVLELLPPLQFFFPVLVQVTSSSFENTCNDNLLIIILVSLSVLPDKWATKASKAFNCLSWSSIVSAGVDSTQEEVLALCSKSLTLFFSLCVSFSRSAYFFSNFL